MSEPLYQVLFRGANGRDNLSDPEPLDDAQHTARELERKGYTVGAVMDVKSAGQYMEYHYATEYRGVRIPDDLRVDGAPRSVYDAWRRGVDSMLSTTRPALAALTDEGPCAADDNMRCVVHDEPGPCPHGLARDLLKATEEPR